MKSLVFFLIILLSFFFNKFIFAKENYTLLNPTPDNKLRAMSTERSSKADYVTTVDAGRVQIETSVVSVVKDKNCASGNCIKTNSTTFGDTTTLRLGLTQNSDFQLMFNPYAEKRISGDENSVTRQGFSDLLLRYKYSFAGNNNEKFGIAATPFLKLPTNQDNLGNDDYEGGVSIPFAYNLDHGYTIGGMSQFNFLKEQRQKKNYYVGYANMIYITKSLTEKFYVFAEYFTYKADVANSYWQNTADFGAHYFVTNNFKIDAGFNIGLTNAADDLNYYTGFAYRF